MSAIPEGTERQAMGSVDRPQKIVNSTLIIGAVAIGIIVLAASVAIVAFEGSHIITNNLWPFGTAWAAAFVASCILVAKAYKGSSLTVAVAKTPPSSDAHPKASVSVSGSGNISTSSVSMPDAAMVTPSTSSRAPPSVEAPKASSVSSVSSPPSSVSMVSLRVTGRGSIEPVNGSGAVIIDIDGEKTIKDLQEELARHFKTSISSTDESTFRGYYYYASCGENWLSRLNLMGLVVQNNAGKSLSETVKLKEIASSDLMALNVRFRSLVYTRAVTDKITYLLSERCLFSNLAIYYVEPADPHRYKYSATQKPLECPTLLGSAQVLAIVDNTLTTQELLEDLLHACKGKDVLYYLQDKVGTSQSVKEKVERNFGVSHEVSREKIVFN